jgi:glycosyltransferase involved in cell wall biosynthesis
MRKNQLVSPPTISIAMATYNGEKYLPEQLASLRAQTTSPVELVVCDDMSSDNTFEILKEFAETSGIYVRAIRNETRLGYKKNFIKAASLCSGDVVAFCDQDDIWLPEKLEILQRTFLDSDGLSLTHDFSMFWTYRSETLPSYFEQLRLSGRSRACNIKGCTMAYRRDLLDPFGWPDDAHGWAHDSWIALISAMQQRREFIDMALIKHRLHENNASGWIMRANAFGRLLAWFPQREISSKELGELISVTINEKNIDSALKLAHEENVPLNERQRSVLISFLEKRKCLLKFRNDGRYKNSLWRLAGSLLLLISGKYARGDGFRAFASDVLARSA